MIDLLCFCTNRVTTAAPEQSHVFLPLPALGTPPHIMDPTLISMATPTSQIKSYPKGALFRVDLTLSLSSMAMQLESTVK